MIRYLYYSMFYTTRFFKKSACINLHIYLPSQFRSVRVWVGHILGLNQWVCCGASDQFQAANQVLGKS